MAFVICQRLESRSPATVASCPPLVHRLASLLRACFGPRLAGEYDFTLALRHDFTSISLSKRTLAVELSNLLGTHKRKARRKARLKTDRWRLRNVELLLMQRWIALYDHGFLGQFFHLVQCPSVVGFERLGHFRIYPQHHVRMFEMPGQLPHLEINLVAYRGHRLHEARRLAIRTRGTDRALQRLLHPLAGNRHQSEVVKLQNL